MLERSWIVGVVLFTIGRFAVAYGTLERYGVNLWMFGAIDLLTAVPYGLGTARLVGAIVDRRFQSATRWGVVSAASFLAPYLYLAWAGRDVGFPPVVFVVLGVLAFCFGTNAVLGIRRRVRTGANPAVTASAPASV